MKWLHYFAIGIIFLYGSFNILIAVLAVPAATPDRVVEIEGIFERTSEAGTLDVVIELRDSTRHFYVNRGYDNHVAFDVSAFEREVRPGDTVILTAYKRWLVEEGTLQRRVTPLAGVRTPEKVYLATDWMGTPSTIQDGWVVGLTMYVVLFALLFPNFFRQRKVTQQLVPS